MNQNSKDNPAGSSGSSNKKRKLRLRTKVALVLLAIVGLVTVATLPRQPIAKKEQTQTYLDTLRLSDLKSKPQAVYEESAPVRDYSIYGTSLVLYESLYEPLGRDAYFGRNVMLKNVETGEETRLSFTGGADGGIDVQTLPAGIYEIFVYDGYTPKRAYMGSSFESEPFVTVRNNKQVKSVQLNADANYLEKLGVESDKNYLYLTVTDTLPAADIADVVIDPFDTLIEHNGNLVEGYSQEDFSEAQASWDLARKTAQYLESAGLRVVFSHEEGQPEGYLGAGSRTASAYDSKAKYFLSLAMSDGEESRPFVVSSPFVNALLGNAIVLALNAQGIELEAKSSLDQLNPGNSYDLLSTDEEYQYTQFSLQPALRETGGKVTSAGMMEDWEENRMYLQSYGLSSVLFCYASAQNPDSIEYFRQHIDAIARGLAQGILDDAHIAQPIEEPQTDSASPAQSEQTSQDQPQDSSAVSLFWTDAERRMIG